MGQAESAPQRGSNPRDIKKIENETMSSFQKGVKHNMKIIIRGDRQTGKTALFRRLGGAPYSPDYIPTPEIQTAFVSWSYKLSEDIVKVELWDIVDEADDDRESPAEGEEEEEHDSEEEGKSKLAGALAEGKMGSQRLYKLDAETVDVYKGTDGVVVVR